MVALLVFVITTLEMKAHLAVTLSKIRLDIFFIQYNANMTPRLSGHFSIFGLVFVVLKSLLGIERQWSREQFAILPPRPRSHV